MPQQSRPIERFSNRDETWRVCYLQRRGLYIPDEDSAEAGHYTPEFLNTISPNGLPPFRLELKVGQPIILLRNIHPAQGICNGTRLIVRQLGRSLIGAEIMIGINRGHIVLIPRVLLTNADDDLAFQSSSAGPSSPSDSLMR